NEEFIAGIHRHGAKIRIKSGVDKEGRLLAREVEILFNNGAYAGFRPRMTLGGVPRAAGCYRIPNVRIMSACVYTNQVPCGHMRGPGQPQVTFAVESHTDLMARRLGMDPVEFRRLNLMRDGDEGPLGGIWRSVSAGEVVGRAAAAIGWGKRKKDGLGRGLAVSERHTGSGPATVAIEIDVRGQVLVRTGVPEVGTGSHTVLRQVVGTVLAIDPSGVVVLQGDTENGPFDGGSGGSHVTNATGGAALAAAQALRARLCSLAADHQGWPRGSVELKDGQFVCRGKSKRIAFRELAGRLAKLQGGVIREESEVRAGHGEASGYACHAVQVTVDRETGQVRIERAVAVHDVGCAINPSGLTGQIEGGFSQGFGMGLTEDMCLEEGRLQSVNYGDYKIPCAADIPSLSSELIENRDGPGPFGAKGIGEIAASPTPAAIANAVEDAVGVRIFDLPVSAEKVLTGLKAKG
ncbi:MAG: xanthine dehydrogenase family protein molybdopterin-binding subunit, partial [Dehalococcoidia bacterium]